MTDRREFPQKVRAQAFARAAGRCEHVDGAGNRCPNKLQVGKYRYDHVDPDWFGGEPTLENCCVQCLGCDTPKTAADQTRIAKTKRQHLAHIGAKQSARPMPGSRNSPFKRKIGGGVVMR